MQGKQKDGLDDLVSFEVASARCYDPNEEARLRNIISVSGEFAFSSRIRALAEACRSAQQRWGFIDLGMGMSALGDFRDMLKATRKGTDADFNALYDRVEKLETRIAGKAGKSQTERPPDDSRVLELERLRAKDSARMNELETRRESDIAQISELQKLLAELSGKLDALTINQHLEEVATEEDPL